MRSFLRSGPCARRQKVLFEDRLLQFQPRPSNKSIRPLTRKQLVEHNTHRVNIRCRRHWITTYLFGRSILRSHRTQDGTRCFVRWSSAFFGQQLGNSEIQELHMSCRINQNVGRLQITMNDEVVMCILNCVADLKKDPESLLDSETLLVAICGYGLALDALHNEEG